MTKRIRMEADPLQEEDLVLKYREMTPEIARLERAIQAGYFRGAREMSFWVENEEFMVPLKDVLFFESTESKVYAHTNENMYLCDKTLSQLTDLLGGDFFRVSKSCIVNLRKITSLRRELTGICEARFWGSPKSVYISRLYYKPFRERFDELRLGK